MSVVVGLLTYSRPCALPPGNRLRLVALQVFSPNVCFWAKRLLLGPWTFSTSSPRALSGTFLFLRHPLSPFLRFNSC